jgi:DNA-binding Lrp family transcriptional regulator
MAAKARAKVKAYVLIETSAGKTKSVKTGLSRLKGSTAGVVNLDAVTGPYDFIAVIEGSTLDHLGRLVTDGIGAIDGVTRTTTCVAVTVG